MKFESANESARIDEKRLIYYVIITGKGKYQVTYSFHKTLKDAKAWTRIGGYRNVLAVQHKGINFSVYDYGEPEKNVIYASIFDDVMKREGLT